MLPGLTYIDATRTGPGAVSEFGLKGPDIVFGEEDGSESERVARVRDALDVEGHRREGGRRHHQGALEQVHLHLRVSAAPPASRGRRSTDQVVMTPETLEFRSEHHAGGVRGIPGEGGEHRRGLRGHDGRLLREHQGREHLVDVHRPDAGEVR